MIRSKLLCAAALSIACIAGLSACSSTAPANDSVAATVNGVEISEQTITDYVQDFREVQDLSDDDSWAAWMANYGYTPETVREQVLDQFIDDELTKQAAEENGVVVTDEEVQEQVDMMKANYGNDDAAWESALTQAGVTEEQYRDNLRSAMLEQRLEEIVLAESDGPSDEEILDYVKTYAPAFSGARRSSHILFSIDDSKTAQEVLDQINSGEVTFEEVFDRYPHEATDAQDQSQLPISQDVGWDLLNSFVTEYTDALSELDEGEVSDLVTSDFGIHIIKCTEVYEAPEEVKSVDDVPSELVDYITQMVASDYENNAYVQWAADYKENAEIVINEMPEGIPYDVDMSAYATEDEGEEADADASDAIEVEPVEEGADADAADADAESADGTTAADTEDTDAEGAESEGAESGSDANGTAAEDGASEGSSTSKEEQ